MSPSLDTLSLLQDRVDQLYHFRFFNLIFYRIFYLEKENLQGSLLWKSSYWGCRWQAPADPGWGDRGSGQVWWGRGRGGGGGPRQISLSPGKTPQCLGRLQQRSRGLSFAISKAQSQLGGRLERAGRILHEEAWLDHSQNLLRGQNFGVQNTDLSILNIILILGCSSTWEEQGVPEEPLHDPEADPGVCARGEDQQRGVRAGEGQGGRGAGHGGRPELESSGQRLPLSLLSGARTLIGNCDD